MTNFSVVIPVCNRPELIRECLQVFRRPDAQGIEVIVVDDGSTDATAEVVEEIADGGGGAEIRLIRQKNAGAGPARNTGAAAARHSWLVFLDSDDLWLPWTVETLRGVLGRADDAQALFFAAQPFRHPDETREWLPANVVTRRRQTMIDVKLDEYLPLVASSNLGFRRQAFLELGGFDAIRHGEDTDFFYRAGSLGPVEIVAAPVLLGYREHPGERLTTRKTSGRQWRVRGLLARNRQGFYTGPAEKRSRALARTVVYQIRSNFADGNIYVAYGTYLQGWTTMAAAGRWGEILRLPLTPVMHYVRPKNYPFRWSGRRA